MHTFDSDIKSSLLNLLLEKSDSLFGRQIRGVCLRVGNDNTTARRIEISHRICTDIKCDPDLCFYGIAIARYKRVRTVGKWVAETNFARIVFGS